MSLKPQTKSTSTRSNPRDLPPKLPPDLCPSTPGEWISYVRAADLPRGPKLTMFVLLDHINWATGENAYPSQATLAQECGCSVTQLQNDLDALIAVGEMEKETRKTRKGNRGNRYKLTPRETKQGWSRSDTKSVECDTKSVRSDTKSVECDTKSNGLRDQAHLAGTSQIEPPRFEPALSEPARPEQNGKAQEALPAGGHLPAGANGNGSQPAVLKPVPTETNPAWSRSDERASRGCSAATAPAQPPSWGPRRRSSPEPASCSSRCRRRR